MWKLALHSVSYAGVWEGQVALSLEAFLTHAAETGFQGVMLMAKRGHASLLEMDSDRRRTVRAQMHEKGLELAALAAYTDFTAGADRPEIPLLEMQIVYVRECARLTQELDGKIVRIFTGYERSELTPAQNWLRCVRAVREAARQAADYGVTLAVQNHHDIAVHPDALYEFLTEVDEPNVKAGYDAWAPNLQGLTSDQIAASVRRLAPFIVQTIVADYSLQPRFRYVPTLTNYAPHQMEARAVPMGEGVIDYTTFFTALRETGYDGFVTYEMCSPLRGGGSLENLDSYARHFQDWMEAFQESA